MLIIPRWKSDVKTERNLNGETIFFTKVQYVVTEPPVMAKISPAMEAGKMVVPVSRSVPAKEANSMLLALWSLRVLLTAAMTNAFIRTTKGQQNTSRITEANVTEKLIMKYSSSWNRWQYSLESGSLELLASKVVFWWIDMVFGISEAAERLTQVAFWQNVAIYLRKIDKHVVMQIGSVWSSTDWLKLRAAWNQGFDIFHNINVTEKVPSEIK